VQRRHLLFLVALWTAKTDIMRASGLDKVVALSNLCFAIPLAVFGAEHLSGGKIHHVRRAPYMPWPLFWAYFVGFALRRLPSRTVLKPAGIFLS
jgi:hypothetical protein